MLKLGERLKEKRLEKGLSLEDVSKSTKIREDYLLSIEEGKYDDLPSATHAQGFVRNYIKFLGLNEKEALALFRREVDSEKAYRVLPKGFESKDDYSRSRFKLRQTATFMLFILGLFILYILYQYRYAFLNPPLSITSPKDSQVVNSSQVKVSGKTDPNSTVYVNKNAVSVDNKGNFQQIINVFPGKTLIEIKVVNKFSRETDRKVEIDVKGGS